jgi:ferredoxin-type protein NapH
MLKKYRHAILAFVFVLLILIPVHTQVERPMLLLERFLPGWGWIEILLLAFYGGFISCKMVHATNTAAWRIRIWTLFSFVFFGQLLLGLIGFEEFLMTGELHFPIPAMIIAGPVYRFQIGFMPILFLTTIVLSGPAWCSQLCYFGAVDALFSQKGRPQKIRRKKVVRWSIFIAVILAALLLRFLQLDVIWPVVFISLFGLTGLVIILFFSRKKGAMIHCTSYCPVGVAVSYLKFVNPFRMKIGAECTLCQKCTRVCRYDALNLEDLKAGKPGINCTWCGDCVSSCSSSQITYKLFNFKPEISRISWIVLTVVIHTVFLGLARI